MSFLRDNLIPGCYFIHVGTELADSDDRVKSSLKEYLSEIESQFDKLLIRHDYSQSEASYISKHLLGLYCTAMSFCLIHDNQEQERYLSNSINLMLSKNG